MKRVRRYSCWIYFARLWRETEPVYAASQDDAYVCGRLCYPIAAAHGRLRVMR